MRLSAVDCLGRGVASLAANWELVLLRWLQLTLTMLLTVAGVAVPLMVLGIDAGSLATLESPGEWEQGLADLLERLPDLLPALAVSLLAVLTLWTLAFLVYCWFQAGTYGILTAADRQAPPGPPGPRRSFRAFSPAAYFGEARRNAWRFFWFLNLFGLWVSFAVLAALVPLVLGAAGLNVDGEGMGTLVALGCGGALLFCAVLLVLGAWFSIAQADLAHESSGVRIASRRGWRILGRRFGAVALLFLIFFGAATVLSTLFFPLSLAIDVAVSGNLLLQIAAQLALAVLQGLPNALLAIALGGAFVALVRSETQSEQEMYAA